MPFNTWDQMEPWASSRSSKDCFRCPSTVHGTVTDLGDSTYEVIQLHTYANEDADCAHTNA